MVENELPEEIIGYILTRLPVRSLIQFSSVSKRWRSIISDPRFAKLHWKLASEQKTLSRRLLISAGSQLLSIDLEETRSTGDNPSSINKLSYPVEKPGSGCRVNLVGSCNGLVCVANDVTTLLIWNPSTGFSHKLPEPHLPRECVLKYFGFGYLSATDDYKVVVGTSYNYVKEMKIFSLRAQIWKRIESPVQLPIQRDGVGLNEALHWLDWIRIGDGFKPAIFVFDLAKEEFRKMSLPFVKVKANRCGYKYRLGVSCDGCLYVMCYELALPSRVYVDFWVLREYGALGFSWIKLKFKAFKEHEEISRIEPILLMETGAVVAKFSERGMELVRIDRHEEGKPGESSAVVARYNRVVEWHSCDMMMKYVASLQLLDEYDQDGVEEHKVKRLKTQHKAEARRRGLD